MVQQFTLEDDEFNQTGKSTDLPVSSCLEAHLGLGTHEKAIVRIT